MEHVLFFLFSFLEFAAGLSFVLALFRFDFVEYRTHNLYSAFILTEISYLLRMGFDLEPISLVVQMVSVIVMFILLYQFPIFSSIIIGTVGYILFGLLQMLIQVFLTLLTPLSLPDLYEMGYVIQTLTAAAGFMAAGLARRMRIGVGLLPRQQSGHLHFDTENVLIFSIMVITVLTILTYSIFLFDQVMTTVVLMVLLLVQILLLIYLANRKVKRSD